ncbi:MULTISPECIES: DUF362 domain-containing protein [unclassified Archaeoglobus]|jgi:uncharacterized protein (DUF362 family)|uniref:DUF362 domain-containing protein n=1 Tax=unclassified Archaeoglobus TaxID=2643606 RepID=UPI0025BBFD01|nr:MULTISPECIES: DUF362 domain-containing protein [unclassified Archaeoglobus]
MKVVVERVKSYKEVGKFIERAFELFNPKFKYVKPNFLKLDSPENGCITHPELVRAIVEAAKEYGMEPIIVEGGFYKDSAEKCFERFGLREIAECVNLNADEFVDVNISGEALKSVEVAKTSLKARECYLTVPKLKVHHLATVTLGIKNNMGFLKKPAIYMHRNIHQKLIDLLSFFQPSLTIIDGIIGGTNSEMRPKPVKHEVMIASDNVVAADIIGARLMGFDPSEIQHLRLAMERFEISESDVEVISNPGIEKLVKEYSLSLSSRMLRRLGI